MSLNVDDLINLATELSNPELETRKKYKLLKYIYKQDLTLSQLQKSRIGKSVKKCTKISGKVKDISMQIIKKWEGLIDNYCEKRKSKLSASKNSSRNSEIIKSSTANEVILLKGDECLVEQDEYEFENHDKSFQDCMNESSSTNKELSRKRKSNSQSDDQKQLSSAKKKDHFSEDKIQDIDLKANHSDYISNESKIMQMFNNDSSDLSNDQLDMVNVEKTRIQLNNDCEDVDVTSKYSSERKVWVPKSKLTSDNVESPEKCEYLNDIPVAEILNYNANQLLDFEGDNKKIIRQTNEFWKKLFLKNYKNALKFEDEKWRDAYIRIQREEEEKLRKISERLNRKTEINKQNETRAKLIKEPFKQSRKCSNYRK